MGMDRWDEVIAKLQPHVRGLRITGGEPTLHKQFPDLIKNIDFLGVPFVVFTNGDWTDANAVIKTLQSCANLKGLLVSLHGSSAATYRRFTSVDAFEKVIANIKRATSAGLRVATNTLLLSTTVNKLPEIAELAFSAGVANISFGRYYGPVLGDLSLSVTELKRELHQIAKMRQEDQRISLSNCVPACFLPDEDFGGGGCTSGFTHCTIGPLGDVRPCTHSEVILGSLPDDDIEELWRSSAIATWRNLITDECLGCAALNRCRGGCRAVAQKLAVSRDPLCIGALKESKKEVVTLGMLDRPKLSCIIETTDFGIALNGTGYFVTLSHQSKPILNRLNGNTTVKEILKEFGPASLELMGGLLRQRLLELRE
jgi:radical SAM protein with 4Fe4S-binding SPASM domain